MTVRVNETRDWGYRLSNVEPEVAPGHPDFSMFSERTRWVLVWLSDKGLRPVAGPRILPEPPPWMTVRFGQGSGWLRGELTISRQTAARTT